MRSFVVVERARCGEGRMTALLALAAAECQLAIAGLSGAGA